MSELDRIAELRAEAEQAIGNATTTEALEDPAFATSVARPNSRTS